MRILVTGAAGLIGHRVIEILGSTHEPIALLRSKAGATPFVDCIEADLADPSFASKLPATVGAVIHLAQAPGFTNFPEDASSVFKVNVSALTELLNWASRAGARTFVHASTGGLYGRGAQPFREEDPLNIEGPLSFYYGTKAAAELLAKAYGKVFNIVALRYFFVYGPRQRETMLIPRLVKSVRLGNPVTLAGPDGMFFNPIYVDDAAEAAVAALDLEQSATVNVAGEEVVSLRTLSEIIGECVGTTPNFQTSDDTAAQDIIGDASRMRSTLHQPRVLLREGITRVVEYAEPAARP